MPFLRSARNNKKIKNQCVTLQVRNPLWKLKIMAGKRVSFAISRSWAGSMTVEAALGLTMFLFFMALMAAPMSIMDTRRKLQARLEAEGEKIAQYAYLTAGVFSPGTLEPGEMELVSGLSQGAVRLMVERSMEEAADTDRAGDFSASASRILKDGETIDLIVNYTIRLPFPIFTLDRMPQQIRCIRRAWTGKEGRNGGEGGAEDEENEIVYMGKDGSRYHRSRTCHYLYNDLSAVAFSEVGSLRSQSGERYRPCAVCGGGSGGTVYVMPSGETYHSRKNCSAIVAYVRAVPLESVSHLGTCSYCSQ